MTILLFRDRFLMIPEKERTRSIIV